VIYGTQLAIHFMRENKIPGGKIVATASVAAIVPHESYLEYAGAKAAVVNFVRATSRILRSVCLPGKRMDRLLIGDRRRTSASTRFAQGLFTRP
jgi:NADP-dependent 3-hydroxy acid dehydrogenase YdfG